MDSLGVPLVKTNSKPVPLRQKNHMSSSYEHLKDSVQKTFPGRKHRAHAWSV
jgi:hypothetical protein